MEIEQNLFYMLLFYIWNKDVYKSHSSLWIERERKQHKKMGPLFCSYPLTSH